MAKFLESRDWRHLKNKGSVHPKLVPRENDDDPFSLMGKPIPYYARQAGYEHCIIMGCDKERAMAVVDAVSEQLARDKPYDAMEAGAQVLDLTGVYRLFAVLLATNAPGTNKKAGKVRTLPASPQRRPKSR